MKKLFKKFHKFMKSGRLHKIINKHMQTNDEEHIQTTR